MILVDEPQFIVAVVKRGETFTQPRFALRPSKHIKNAAAFARQSAAHRGGSLAFAFHLVELQEGDVWRIYTQPAVTTWEPLTQITENRLSNPSGKLEAGADPTISAGPRKGTGCFGACGRASR